MRKFWVGTALVAAIGLGGCASSAGGDAADAGGIGVGASDAGVVHPDASGSGADAGHPDASHADASSSHPDAGTLVHDAGAADAGAVHDAGSADTPDGGTGTPDAGDYDAGTPMYPPDQRGPYQVGYRELDVSRGAVRKIGVWYPSTNDGDEKKYLLLLKGTAHADGPIDATGAPYPLVMFSHGNKGIEYQSFSMCEHLASHGFVIAAPRHTGNTLFDNPNDEAMAAIAMRRPQDVMDAMALVQADGELSAIIDMTRVAIAGHSFGGYTSLLLAGADVDVSAASARCAGGVAGNVFCPYIGFWPQGTTVTRPAAASIFRASVGLAAGSYAAFGDLGLSHVTMPVLLMGGTLDEYTLNDLAPMYSAMPPTKLKVVVDRGGHMMFTDLCRIPATGAVPTLGELCNHNTHIDIDRGFTITNAYVTAFLRRTLNDDRQMAPYLRAPYAATFPEIHFERSP